MSTRSGESSLGHSGGPSRFVRRQEVDEPAHLQQRLHIVVEAPSAMEVFVVCTEAPPSSSCVTTSLGHCLHHVRTRHIHVRRVADHEDEVGHRRGIDVPARAGSHDQADLRDHAGGRSLALEHLAIAARGRDAFLDAGPAGVEDADTIGARIFSACPGPCRSSGACVSDSEPPNTVKSLAKTKIVRPLTVPQPVTTPSPGIFCFSCRTLGRAMLDEHVELLERAVVQQQLDALARRVSCPWHAAPQCASRHRRGGRRTGAAPAVQECASWPGQLPGNLSFS